CARTLDWNEDNSLDVW
nr:immunoglobulin heavy chain junction region [Macaca mulatta]MOV49194.1 immunoglobulin heavy chain junction region [Macaca mulatta]MOV49331.1 immunoglobulin heavy chain junction region [Macaca mulatta]MOV49346.1 immunoglobulin heavy chain junction region [Macaca mulatta]MOV49579.1 immunoglobulin heavy chain junction region [Macaca mulatta]